MMRSIQAALLIVALVPPAQAQQAPENKAEWQAREAAHYRTCMAQTRTDSEAAFDDAVTWQGLGGGAPARHCRAAALMEIGHDMEAAQGLEKLALEIKAEADFKARLLVQSATAWLAAGDGSQARQMASAALTLVPDHPDALLARAKALELLGAYWEMVDDLDTILSTRPTHVEALVLRGAAYRQLGTPELALEDLGRALALQPEHPGGLLERGTVYRLQGDKAAARADWRLLIEAHPKSALAKQAAIVLHRLDSGAD